MHGLYLLVQLHKIDGWIPEPKAGLIASSSLKDINNTSVPTLNMEQYHDYRLTDRLALI